MSVLELVRVCNLLVEMKVMRETLFLDNSPSRVFKVKFSFKFSGNYISALSSFLFWNFNMPVLELDVVGNQLVSWNQGDAQDVVPVQAWIMIHQVGSYRHKSRIRIHYRGVSFCLKSCYACLELDRMSNLWRQRNALYRMLECEMWRDYFGYMSCVCVYQSFL